ncbi:hypothetical protein CROQUDRAFT_8244, partial [Cronartium quercuum f. sp. fusiforme G11]
SPAEKAAHKLFIVMMSLGQELDIVTHMGTNSSEIVKHIDLIVQQLDKGESARKQIFNNVSNPKPEIQNYVTEGTENTLKL